MAYPTRSWAMNYGSSGASDANRSQSRRSCSPPRGAPFTTAGWRKMVARLGVAAKLGFKAHPHMFRHACGFRLANQRTDTRTLQAYLGHRNIQHTVRYTELSPTRFKNLWRD